MLNLNRNKLVELLLKTGAIEKGRMGGRIGDPKEEKESEDMKRKSVDKTYFSSEHELPDLNDSENVL